MFSKLLILIIMALILFALFRGLYCLVHDSETSARTVKALTVRIALSCILFLLLLLGFWMGWLRPH